MQSEYINKIIEIGKKGSCTSENLSYFLPNLPHIANLRGLLSIEQINRALGNNTSSGISHSASLFINFVKGCHLIEMKCGGFGSTSATHQMILRLHDNNITKDLYNWIALNGGNYFIESNITFEESQRKEKVAAENRKKILENDQKIHLEAVARKKHNQDLHTLKSNKSQKLYKDLKERFHKMDDKELLTNFNREVGKTGWTSSRAMFLAAIREEFENRAYDYSAIGNKKRLSFAKKVELIDEKIVEIKNG